MIVRSIVAALLMLVAPLAWAQGESATSQPTPAAPLATPSTPATPAMSGSTAPAATPDNAAGAASGEEAPAPTDEETGGNTSGPMTSTDKIVDRFMQLDTDGSTGVSFDEYMAMVQQRAQDRFKSMDANQDGEVTADEFRQFWQSRMAQLYRLKR